MALKRINPREIAFSPLSSGVDTFGRVFHWENRLFRAIHPDSVQQCQEMFSSGMIDELVRENYIPGTTITDYEVDGFGMVLEHERIQPANYPEEWSFSMFKDTAVTVLKMNMLSRKYGFQTKDCHGYNLMFDGCRPKHLDLGSLVKSPMPIQGLVAADEFIRYYMYILKIWSEGNDYIARRILTAPMPQYSYNLYCYGQLEDGNSRMRERLKKWAKALLPPEIRRKAKTLYKKYAATNRRLGVNDPFIGMEVLLEKSRKFRLAERGTPWARYHDEYYDGQGLKSTPRYDRIIQLVKGLKIKTITDLGGGQGVVSRLLIQRANVEKAICIDCDGNAVDRMYNAVKNLEPERGKIVPVLMDFAADTSLLGYENFFPYSEGRFKSDGVMALALTHHLILSQNRSVDYILGLIAKYTRKYAFIEFMPLGLWSEGGNGSPSPPWYTVDWFREHFKKIFRIILEEKIEKNRILFLGELLGE